MLERFYPKEYVDSTYNIDFEKYYEDGYRSIIFDIDNTLVPHGAPADDRAIALILNNTYRPKNGESMKLLFDMIDRVVENADIFEMSCRNEPAAAQMSYKAMKG